MLAALHKRRGHALDLEEADTVCKTKTAASFQRHAHHLPTKWTARYSLAAPGRPGRYLELWGRFGLLNNRLRCLANAVGFCGARRRFVGAERALGAVRRHAYRRRLVDRIEDSRCGDRDHHAWPPSEYFANRTVRPELRGRVLLRRRL